MSYTYNSVQPEAVKDSYSETDTCDFVLTFENKSLVLDTLKVEGFITTTDNVNSSMDAKAGIHGIIDTISVDTQNRGNIQTLNEYTQYVHMISGANYARDDYYNSQFISELRCDAEVSGANYLKPSLSGVPPDFSFKPLCALNQSVGDNKQLGFSKSGSITIRIRLRKNAEFLHGVNLTSGASYSVSNLKLCYATINGDNKQPVVMKTYHYLSQNVDTKLANINTKVPAVCSGVACSFYPIDNLNQPTLNQSETVSLPELDEVIFMFNDSTSRYITYPIRTLEEVKSHYLESLSFSSHNSLTLNSDKNFGIGLDFNQMIDLRNQKFNVQIKSGITSRFKMHMYFLGVIGM